MRAPLALAVAFVLGVGIAPAASSAATSTGLPPIHHVWEIELENESYTAVLGGNSSSYLGTTVRKLGQVLTQYYAVGHNSADNYIAQVSGQAPNLVTQLDCIRYSDVTPAIVGPGGQVVGEGCIYPSSVKTVADQITAAGLTWKGYMGDMGNTPARDHTDAAGDCGHPVFNTTDGTQTATATDQYATRHDPFPYFHSIIDSKSACDDIVPLTRLAHDLKTVATTPNFNWISPNLCDDGHDNPCTGVNVAGTHAGGLVSTNLWLAKYLPMILASPAYKADGAVIITWDESDTADSATCCGETAGPGSPLPGLSGPGGGHVATIVISPFTKPGTTNPTPYNHYSALRSIEDIFGLSHLAAAGASGLRSFGLDVFDQPRAGAGLSTPATASVPVPSNQLPLTGGDLPWGAGVAALAGFVALLLARRLTRA